jgi:L,D-transpeptidase YbiS
MNNSTNPNLNLNRVFVFNKSSYNDLMYQHLKNQEHLLLIISQQTLYYLDSQGKVKEKWLISTGANPPNEQKNSGGTPRGWHIIRAKIGENAPENTVFVGRRPTGEIFTPQLDLEYPKRDWILTRILWLSGCEKGINRLQTVDTMQRYVYIHGTPDRVIMGKAGSKGCVRMRNKEIITFFDNVHVGIPVYISEYSKY